MMKKTRGFRLYIVGGLFAIVTLVLWARLVQVQVFARDHYDNLAEDQWKVTQTIPPVRGGIFDRNGRPLALSIRSCSVSLSPNDVRSPNHVVAVLAKELALPASELRKKLRSKKSFVWVRRQCSLTAESREKLRSLAGVGLHWEADRVYPFDRTAAKIVGFVGHDAKGMAGVEAAFDSDLAGEPGWEVVQRDGRYRSKGYYTYSEKRPVDGKHVILTIDAGLQEIAETEIQRAVTSRKAKSGALIVIDCNNGEVLALAEYPGPSRDPRNIVDSLWTVRSVTHMYEPGSTFKLVTAAALLETDKVNSFDVFDAENGKADLGVAVIKDSHPYGHLTFREGFLFSSNIVLAKASTRLESLEFFEFVRLFGFGARSGIELLGESPGMVAEVEDWSDRTQVTMAFGQEIAVTPLQMANAFAAVAADGILRVPRVVRSIVDENSGDVEVFDPIVIRRVVSTETARRLRAFCRSVVEEGTGTNAALSYLDVAGKTGTAEKATRRGGYSTTKFVSSFIGFAPADEPEIVCLVMLDEPNYYNRFGGVSCAPVFSRINAALSNSFTTFDGVLSSDVLGEEKRGGDDDLYIAPNFLRYSRERALARARELGLNVLCKGNIGEVVAQDPDPGVTMERDGVVRLYLSGPSRSAKAPAPDLRGLTMRVAKRKATEAGFRCEVVGTGVVATQRPVPGASSKAGVVRIYCEDKSAK